jgi:hypothetical protein
MADTGTGRLGIRLKLDLTPSQHSENQEDEEADPQR